MSTQVSILKRSSQTVSQDLPVSPPKKICTADAKSQAVSQQRLPLSAASPQRVSTPMKNHTYEGVTQEKLKQLKKFKNKGAHTLAPAAMNGDFRSMQQHFPVIRNLQREMDEAAKSDLEIDGVSFEIKKEEVTVLREGRRSTFGFHHTETAEGVKQRRAFPKSGDGVVTIKGDKVFELVQTYKRTAPKMSFEEFVAQERENLPPTQNS